jgi:serine/threonine protein kinase
MAAAQSRLMLNTFQPLDAGAEKFKFTYVDNANCWRRGSLSYASQNAEKNSLERELDRLQSLEEKESEINLAILDKLCDIRFLHDAATHLHVKTENGVLYVHVQHNVDNIIDYPTQTKVDTLFHRGPPCVREHQLVLDSQLSSFAYKVRSSGKAYVKKDIRDQAAAEAFLYEIRVWYSLRNSPYVAQMMAVVLSDDGPWVKGILVEYVGDNTLLALLAHGYTSWQERQQWGEHTVRGVHEIHAHGWIHGSLMLDHVIVDEKGTARIIGFDRHHREHRGWDAPEYAACPIPGHAGVKTDIFQLGMILWALAMDDHEPERHSRPLSLEFSAEIPDLYQAAVGLCLSSRVPDRPSTETLIYMLADGSPSFSVDQHARIVANESPESDDWDDSDSDCVESVKDPMTMYTDLEPLQCDSYLGRM